MNTSGRFTVSVATASSDEISSDAIFSDAWIMISSECAVVVEVWRECEETVDKVEAFDLSDTAPS